MLQGDGHGGCVVLGGDGGVGPLLEQHPHHRPVAPIAGPPQSRLTHGIAVVDRGLGAGVGQQAPRRPSHDAAMRIPPVVGKRAVGTPRQ
jgi:hypothetical protein